MKQTIKARLSVVPFVFSHHNLRDHAGPGTRRTLARSSPPPHHGQLVRAGEIPRVDQTARILLTFSVNRQIMRISPEVRTSQYALEML